MAEETINVMFKFFQIRYSPDFSGDLCSILDKQLAIPEESRESVNINGVDRVLLNDTYTNNGYKAWLFSSKRMKGIPAKLNAKGVRCSLNLEEDEGLGETMAIACDSTCRVAAIQSNQHAMSFHMLVRMINKFSPDAHVQFLPMLRVDALERLSRSKYLKKVRIKVAGVNSFAHLKDYGLSVADALALQGMQQSPVIDITWSMGNIKNEGLSSWVQKVLKAAIGYKNDQPDNHEVKALEAILQWEDNGAIITDAVDFLTDRLYYPAKVPLNKQREIDEQALLVSAYDALMSKKKEINSYLRKPHEQID